MQNYKAGAKEFFTKNLSEDLESLSGHSSTLINTYYFRDFLKSILKSKKIKTISDCPCGDWNWMRSVKLDGINYTGYDILPELIEANSEKYPKIPFILFDAVVEILPKADLIICKDFLTHLHDEEIEMVLSNFKKSESKFLVSTSYVSPVITTFSGNWGFREISLESFGLTPIESKFDTKNRFHALYELR
jgi:2-polyprenyl-3-methyl-5-hydroxy-6-metoxy-1,4-benzoquinol methylase